MNQNLEKLTQQKIEARKKILKLEPRQAQNLVNQTLYPQYWDFKIEQNSWEESIPTDYEIMEKLTPENLREILNKLQEVNLDVVLVGGQAVNLWAYQYYNNSPELQKYIPFSSEDLDFYGGKMEAIICQETLGGKVILNKDFDPSPNAGIVLVNYKNKTLRIDFLASVYGLNDAEITEKALTFLGKDKLENVKLKVLHPILCLEGKLRCLRSLPQQNRQDLKHTKILIICVNQFLANLIIDSPARTGLKFMERILNNALREDALNAWYHYQIKIEDAIPFDTLEKLQDEKWKNFREIRLPQIKEQINLKRLGYQKIMNLRS